MVTYFLFIVFVLPFLGLYFGAKVWRTCALSLISLLIALFPLALLLAVILILLEPSILNNTPLYVDYLDYLTTMLQFKAIGAIVVIDILFYFVHTLLMKHFLKNVDAKQRVKDLKANSVALISSIVFGFVVYWNIFMQSDAIRSVLYVS